MDTRESQKTTKYNLGVNIVYYLPSYVKTKVPLLTSRKF